MKLLGIDYGKSKIGFARADSKIAEPLVVVGVKDKANALTKVLAIIDKEEVEKVVVGVSEGELAEETLAFIDDLSKKTKVPIVEFDETLTTKDAQRLAIEAGVGRKRRKQREDAFSAALILQGYIDFSG